MYLHPTMYLLIHPGPHLWYQYLHHLHPTMYLLILSNLQIGGRNLLTFTSHYVSINSHSFYTPFSQGGAFTSHYVSINSLIPVILQSVPNTFTSHYVSINSFNREKPVKISKRIYIPLCIY